MLDAQWSIKRQKRLAEAIKAEGLDAAVVGASHHVYYFTTHLAFWQHHVAAVVTREGATWLLSANAPAQGTAAGEVEAYEANWHGTLRQEQPADAAQRVIERLRRMGCGRVGIDASPLTSQLPLLDAAIQFRAIDPILFQLRRPKDPDEMALIRKAVAASGEMYRRAAQVITPGVTELEVFSQLQAAAIESAGEPLYPQHLGNDYACGAGGGSPRGGRACKAGELYIIDAGPAYRGYYADNARVFAVDRRPTDAQMKAWELVTGALRIVETMARPGVRCRDIYAAVDAHYRDKAGQPMPHHLGHGIGLQPHEYPHLNPRWDDVLIEGEVFTAEPGIYSPEINGGIRIENDYLVTAGGLENLTPFDLSLTPAR